MRTRQVLSSLAFGATCVHAFQSAPSTLVGVQRQRLDRAFVRVQSSVVEDADTTTTSRERTSTSKSEPLPPVLQQIVDERQAFSLKIGKAMDTLRGDYPEILHQLPDFSIYHDNIRVVDPSGVQLSGLKNYKASFNFFQTAVRFLYNPSESKVENRMVYDICRSSIQISFNAALQPRWLGKRPLYVDGISTYELGTCGQIVSHEITKLVVNGIPMKPPYGILSLLESEMGLQPTGVPVGVW
eukprot:CAMPEP_0194046814 /NCGR_PEP_ID=MMETSP0009_2-20130614/22391_1 /TAXON_ID=210454 /ORGANISM="Grammatophora oceanica, Strain CCMP 410" /LENGTH=240 /DNA_ID=CAMNT_0038692243 /DNA_START=31 /DNA_END=750 /DNA_ORIENTATION=+